MANGLLNWYKEKLAREGTDVSKFSDQQLTYSLGRKIEAEYGPQKVKEYPEFSKQYTSAVNAYKAQDLGRDGIFGGIKEIGAGLGQGIDETQGMLYGGAGFLAKKVGLDSASEYLMDKSLDNMRESQVDAPTIQSFSEVNSFGEGVRFLAGGLGRVIPSGATMVGTGGVGGLVGKQVLKKAVVGPALKKEARRLTKKGIDADDYTKSIGKRYADLSDEMKEVASGYAKGLSLIGTTTAASGTMGIGEVYSSLYPYTQLDPQDKEYVTPESAEALSWKFGLAIGALDSILPSMVGGPLLKKFFPGKTPTPSEIADADAFVKRNLLGAVAKGVGVESGTEATQEYLNIVAEKYAHDKKSPFDLSRFTDEEINQMVDGGILGAIGGATFAGFTEGVAGAKALYEDRYAQQEKRNELKNSLDEIIRQEYEKLKDTEEAVEQIAPQKTFEIGQQVITGEGQVAEFKGFVGDDAIIAYQDNPELDRVKEFRVPRKSLSAYEETESEQAVEETTEEENPVDEFRKEKEEETQETVSKQPDSIKSQKALDRQKEAEIKKTLRGTIVGGNNGPKTSLPNARAYQLMGEFLNNENLLKKDISPGKLKTLDENLINDAYDIWVEEFYMKGEYPSKNAFVEAFKKGAESQLGEDYITLGDLVQDEKKQQELRDRKAAEDIRKEVARKVEEVKLQKKQQEEREAKENKRLARTVRIVRGKTELFKFKSPDGLSTLNFPETLKRVALGKKNKTPYEIQPLTEEEWTEETKTENLIDLEKNPQKGQFKGTTSYNDYLEDIELLNTALEVNTNSEAKIESLLAEEEKPKKKSIVKRIFGSNEEVVDGSTLKSLPDVVSGTYTIGTDGKSKRVKVKEGDASTLADIIFNVDVAYKATSITTPDNIKINVRFDGVAVVFKLAEPTFVPVSFKSEDNGQYIFGGEPTLLTNPKEQKHVRVKEIQSVSGKPNPESLFLGTDKSKTYKPRLDLPSSAKSNPNRTTHIVAVRHKPTDKVLVRTLFRKNEKPHLVKIKNNRGQISLKETANAMPVEDVINQENLEIVGAAWLSAHDGTLRQDFDSLVEYENWIDSFDKQPISTEQSSKVAGDIQSEIDKAEDSEYRGRIVELWNKESRTPQEEAELDLATLYFAHKDDIFVQTRSGDGVQGRAFLQGKAPISEYHLGDLFYRRGELLSSTFDGNAALQGSSQTFEKTPDWRFWPEVQYIEDEIKRRGVDPKDANARKEAQEDFLSLGRNYIRIDTSASMREKAIENAPASSEPLLYFTDKNGNLLDNPKPEDLVMDLSLGLFSEKFKTEFAGRIKVTEAFSLLDSSQINLILEAIRSDQTYKGKASEASREKLYEEYKNRGVRKGGEDPKSGEQFKGNAQSFANEIIKAFLQLAPKVDQATGSSIIENLSPDNTSSPSKVKDTLWNPENSLWDSANPFKIKQFAEWLTNDQVNTIIKYSRENLQGIGDDTVARDTINLDQFSELSKNPKRIKKPEKLIYQIIQEFGETTPVLAFVQWMGTQQELDITSNSIDSKKGELSVQEQAEWKELSELYGNEGVEIKDQGFNILLEAEGGAQQKTGKGNITGAMGTRATMYALKLAREVDSSKAYVLTEKMMDAISEALVGDDSLSISLLSAIVDARSNRQNTVRENIDVIEGDRQTFFKAAELIEAISLDALNQVTGKKLRNPYQLFNRVIDNIDKPNVYSTINKAQGEEIEAQGDLEVGVSAPGNYPIQSMADPYLGDSTNYSVAEFSDPYNLTQSSKRRTNFEQNIILPEGQSAKNERAIQNIIGENIFAPVVLERLKRYSENYGISEEAKDFISRYLEVLDQALSNADTPTNIVVVDEISSAPNTIVRGNRVGDTVFISKKFHAGKYDLVAEELPFNFVEDKTTNILMSVLLHEVWHNTMEAPLRLHEQRVNAGQRSEVQETVDLIKDVIKEVKKNPGSKKFTFLYSNENIAVSEILNYAWTRKDFAQFLANTKMTNEGIKKRIDQNGKNIISTLMDALYAAYIKLLKTFGVNPEGTALESILELSMQLEAQNQALIRDDRIVPSNVADRKTLNFLMTDIMDNSEMSMQLLQENKRQVVEEFDSSFEREDDFDYISTVINGDFDGLSPDELNYVKQSLKDLTPRMRNLLRALEREDYFGFDYPFQAIDALLTEDYEYLNGIDVSSSFKASLTKFVDDLLMNRQTMPKKPIPSVLTPIGNQETETLKLDSDGFLKGHKFHVTKTENLESIRRDGIQAQEKSNWVKAGTGERYGKGMVFVMDNYFDAIRWATEMEWNNNQTMGEGSISIVVLEDDTGPIKFSWAEDNADVISTSSNVGKWYMRAKGVPSKQITSSIKVGINEIKSLQTKNTESVEITKFPPKPEIVRKVTPKELTRLVAMEIVWDNDDRQLDRQLAGKLSESTSATYQEVLNEIDQLNSIFRATPIKRRVKFQNLAMEQGIKKYFGKGQNMQDALIEGEENANENQTLNRDANEIAGGKMEAAGHNELLASISEAMDEIRKILKEPTLSVEDVLKKYFPNNVSPLKKIKDLGKEFGGSMQEVTIESLRKNVGMSQHARTIALKLVESRLAKSRQLLSSNLDQLDEKQSNSLKSQVVSLEKQLIVDPSVIFDRSKQGDALSKQVNYERENARQEMADTTVLEIDTGNASLLQSFSEITGSAQLTKDFVEFLNKKRAGRYSSDFLADIIYKVSGVDDIKSLTPKDIYNIIQTDQKVSNNEYILIASALNKKKDIIHQAKLSRSGDFQGKRTTLKKLEDLSKLNINQLKVIKGKNPENSLLTGTRQEKGILESYINKRILYLEKLEEVKELETQNQVHRSLNKYLLLNSKRLQTYLHHTPTPVITDGQTFPVMRKINGEYRLEFIKIKLSNKMMPEDMEEFVKARQANRDYLSDPENERIQNTADFEYIRSSTVAADALTLQPQHQEASGKLNGWWLKSAQEMFSEIGRLGREISQMELRFDYNYRKYLGEAKAHGRRWNRKLKDAAKAWGYKNERTFLDQIYDKVLKWNEDQPQLNDKTSFDNGTYNKALSLVRDRDAMQGNARQALRELLEQSRVTSNFLMDISKALGVKVEEENVKVASPSSTDESFEMISLVRDPIRRGYQTAGRKIRSEYVLGILNELQGKGWADDESWADVKDGVLDKNKTDEAKESIIDGYIDFGVDEYVLNKFIKPYILDTSVKGLLNLPEGGKVPRNYAVEAWENSEGEGNERFKSFIDKLYESVPHKKDNSDFIRFKYGVLKSFHERYERLFEMVNDAGQQGDNKAFALAHRLMDSRSMDTILPVEFLQYETYTETDMPILISQIIGNGVYGRNGKRLTTLREQLKKELGDKRARLVNIADTLGETPPKDAPFKIKRSNRRRAAELAENMEDIPGKDGAEKLKNLESAAQQLANFHNANKHLQAYLEGDLGPYKDNKLLLELLGTNAFLILNQPKSGLTNLLSLFDQPIVYKGLNKFSRKALLSSLGNVFGQVLGPLIEHTGLQLKVTSDYAQWLNDFYHKISEHEVGFRDYKLNLGANASKNASKKEIFKLSGLRQLKDSLQYTPVKKGQKYAPLSLRTMFINPFTYLGNLANHSLGVGAVNAVDMLVKQAADFIEQTGKRLGYDLPQTFEVKAEHLGLQKKSALGDAILGNESMWNYINNAIELRGLGTISDLAHQYIERKKKGKTLALTKDQALAVSSIALHDVAMEGGFTSRSAFWYTNEWAKYAAPLLSWSFSKVNMMNKAFRDEQTNEVTFRATLRALSIMALWLTPIGMAFTFGLDEYDEKILGKASSLRPAPLSTMIPIFGPFIEGDVKSNALAMTERLARAGNIGGIAGDFIASIVSQVDPYTSQRGFSLDTRILGMATILNIRDAVTNAYHSRSLDYNLVLRPLIYSMGGNAFMQTTQAASNLIGFDVKERRISDMIGNRNKVRAALSALEIERRPAISGGFRATPFSVQIRKMEQAAYANDDKLFNEAYSEAIAASIARGDEDPEKQVLQSYKRRTLRSGISRYTMSDQEWEKVLNVFTPEQARSLRRAELQHKKYEEILRDANELRINPLQPVKFDDKSTIPFSYEDIIKQSLAF